MKKHKNLKHICKTGDLHITISGYEGSGKTLMIESIKRLLKKHAPQIKILDELEGADKSILKIGV